MEVVRPQLGNVHQTLGVDLVQRDEDAELGHGAYRTGKILADLVLHEVTLEPVGDVARGLVRAALGLRAVSPEIGPAAGRIGAAFEHGLDGAMHQQVGIAADR